MKKALIMTDSAFKFGEIKDMLALYGVEAVQAPQQGAELALPDGFQACCREASELVDVGDGLHEHRSVFEALREGLTQPEMFNERVRGRLAQGIADSDASYGWDESFYPLGSEKNLHELKMQGLKVSARQLAVGRWIARWLTYPEPAHWRHMAEAATPGDWLPMHPIMQSAPCEPTRKIIERVDAMGAWFKSSWNRRAKHYWWPGLNAGIPMVPKKDYIHELTFLVHDLIHWSMPDAFLDGTTPELKKLYAITRMMSEAITLSMADMAFIDQAKQAGLEYDTAKRRIHPLYDPKHPIRDWCKAMSLYAILGDDAMLARMAKTPEALELFKEKYSAFFEEDLRWTFHNAETLQSQYAPAWTQRCKMTAKAHPQLGLSFASDYLPALDGPGGDAELVERVFDAFWDRHQSPNSPGFNADPSNAHAHRLIRKWLGQSALCDKMADLPLSGLVCEHIEKSIASGDSKALESIQSLWDNYLCALEGLCRLSPNDAELFKAYYPVVSPMYVSYDLDPSAYKGIQATWARLAKPNKPS